MATKQPSARSTKAEILDAFNELLQENKALATQLQTALKPTPRSQSKAETPPQQSERNGAATAETQITIAPVNPIQLESQTVESIIQGLTQLQADFGGAVSDLSEKLTQEAVQLQTVQQSVTETSDQLEQLHDLTADDRSLDELIQQYEESAKAFDEEFSQRRDGVEEERKQAQVQWAKEQEDYRRAIQDRNSTQRKTRDRDGSEYTYDLELARKLGDDAYNQAQKRQYQALDDLQEQQEKQWQEREMAISNREKDFEDLKIKVEGFPEKLETAVKKAKEEGKGIAQYQAKVKADLLAKETEGQQRTYELRIQSLQETLDTQGNRIQSLCKQLDAALKQVQDLAVKAIEGTANQKSLQSMKEIAIEQARTQNKGK